MNYINMQNFSKSGHVRLESIANKTSDYNQVYNQYDEKNCINILKQKGFFCEKCQ